MFNNIYFHYNNLLATIFVIATLVCIFAKSEKNESYLKINGLLLIAAFSFFNNSTPLYLIATIITAALFVNNDFLEKILAIVFMNKDYFKYKIESLTQNEKEDKQIEQIIETVPDNIILTSQNNEKTESLADIEDRMRKNRAKLINEFSKIESYTIKYFERIYNEKIQTDVKISNICANFTCDGILKKSDKEIIFEIKILSNRKNYYGPMILSYLNKIKTYAKDTNKDIELKLIFIIKSECTNIEQIKEFIYNQVSFNNLKQLRIDCIFLTLNEIGYEN